jgi:hypothetical protein
VPPERGVAVNRFRELFIKNTGLRKVVRQYMGADACPVPEGQGSWLETSVSKLTTEAPVNGGRNYDGPKVAKFIVE